MSALEEVGMKRTLWQPLIGISSVLVLGIGCVMAARVADGRADCVSHPPGALSQCGSDR